MDLGQFVLVLCGGVGGALLTWIGTLINNRIHHNRELARMTYQRKLMVCETTMGILGSAKDKLTSIRAHLKQNMQQIDGAALQDTVSKMQKLMNTAEIEIYKLYLYYDIEEVERKLNLQELLPMVLELNSAVSEMNNAIVQGKVSLEEQDRKLQKILALYEYFIERFDNFFTEIIELMKKDVRKKLCE